MKAMICLLNLIIQTPVRFRLKGGLAWLIRLYIENTDQLILNQ